MKLKFELISVSNNTVKWFFPLQHLAGHSDFAPSESWSGPDPDPDPNKQQHADSDAGEVHKKKKQHQIPFSGKGEKTKGS